MTNLDLLPGLYQPSVPHTEITPPEPTLEELDDDEYVLEHNHYRISVDDVEVCFIENTSEIVARIEGDLPDEIIQLILSDTCERLGELEKTIYTYEKISR